MLENPICRNEIHVLLTHLFDIACIGLILGFNQLYLFVSTGKQLNAQTGRNVPLVANMMTDSEFFLIVTRSAVKRRRHYVSVCERYMSVILSVGLYRNCSDVDTKFAP